MTAQELRLKKEAEFNELLNSGKKLSVSAIADFLGMKLENLRKAIKQNQIGGAICTENKGGNDAFYIFPVTFHAWYFRNLT